MPILFSADNSDAVIKEGDLAIVILAHRSFSTITVTKDQVLSNRNGFFPHNSFIGKPWGLKVYVSHAFLHYFFVTLWSG
jgi:tRNA A58 N-methylase Trm61